MLLDISREQRWQNYTRNFRRQSSNRPTTSPLFSFFVTSEEIDQINVLTPCFLLPEEPRTPLVGNNFIGLGRWAISDQACRTASTRCNFVSAANRLGWSSGNLLSSLRRSAPENHQHGRRACDCVLYRARQVISCLRPSPGEALELQPVSRFASAVTRRFDK